jgi:chorismate mutase
MKKNSASHLANHRENIDKIDREILRLLGQRFEVCRKVAEIKKEHSLSVVQQDRIKAVLDHVAQQSILVQIEPAFSQLLYNVIIAETCRVELELISSNDDADNKITPTRKNQEGS